MSTEHSITFTKMKYILQKKNIFSFKHYVLTSQRFQNSNEIYHKTRNLLYTFHSLYLFFVSQILHHLDRCVCMTNDHEWQMKGVVRELLLWIAILEGTSNCCDMTHVKELSLGCYLSIYRPLTCWLGQESTVQ